MGVHFAVRPPEPLEFHLPGKHDQRSHANKGGRTSDLTRPRTPRQERLPGEGLTREDFNRLHPRGPGGKFAPKPRVPKPPPPPRSTLERAGLGKLNKKTGAQYLLYMAGLLENDPLEGQLRRRRPYNPANSLGWHYEALKLFLGINRYELLALNTFGGVIGSVFQQHLVLDTTPKPGWVASMTKHIDAVVNRGRIPRDAVLFANVDGDYSVSNNVISTRKYTVATTESQGGRAQMRIYVKKGQPAVFGAKGYMTILPRNQQFRTHRAYRNRDGDVIYYVSPVTKAQASTYRPRRQVSIARTRRDEIYVPEEEYYAPAGFDYE